MAPPFKIAIRADGSKLIGLGHVMRCGALANALAEIGARIAWLTTTPQHLPAGLSHAVEPVQLDNDEQLADALTARNIHHLVADWHRTDPQRVHSLRANGVHVSLVGNFLQDAVPDLHIRQGFLPGMSPSGAPTLSGPKYLLLPASCEALPPRPVAATARRVLLSLGGTDSPLLARIRDRLAQGFPAIEVDGRGPVGNGPIPPLTEAMRRADIGILAGGTSLHEAAATGLPSLCLPIAANQFERAGHFDSAGLGISLDPADPGFDQQFDTALAGLVSDQAGRQDMARTGQALVDGGGARRVATHLAALITAGTSEIQ
ncbi:hypothetical protein [Maricaulis maris]|uniref:hypothetical protein n=1 Tax=Maricaulis maris TaxID=74318 RepID=UPI003A8D3CC8